MSNKSVSLVKDENNVQYNIRDYRLPVGQVGTGIINDETSSAGALGYQWSSVSTTTSGSNTIYAFAKSVNATKDFTDLEVGDAISCKAGFSWNFCGTVTQVQTDTLFVSVVTANIPTVGTTPGVTTSWTPETKSEEGYLWCPNKPDAGYFTIGTDAVAFGLSTKSNEWGSFTAGELNIADGKNCVAFGEENIVAYESIVSGKKNEVYGYYSGAIGHTNKIYKDWSFAAGNKNTINSYGGISLGGFKYTSGTEFQGNTVLSTGGIAIGSGNKAGDEAGDCGSIAIGSGNKSLHHMSIAIGKENTASGTQSIAMGYNNQAQSATSIAMGWGNISSATRAVTIGEGLTSNKANLTVVGKYNATPASDDAFDIGWGTSSSKKTIFTVKNTGAVNCGAITSSTEYISINGIRIWVSSTGTFTGTPSDGDIGIGW